MEVTMAIPEHIHALPRKTDPTIVYPEGVLVYSPEERTIYVGDGKTVGGLPIPSSDAILKVIEKLELELKQKNDFIAAVSRQQALLFS